MALIELYIGLLCLYSVIPDVLVPNGFGVEWSETGCVDQRISSAVWASLEQNYRLAGILRQLFIENKTCWTSSNDHIIPSFGSIDICSQRIAKIDARIESKSEWEKNSSCRNRLKKRVMHLARVGMQIDLTVMKRQ
jgi:hypothetical protein